MTTRGCPGEFLSRDPCFHRNRVARQSPGQPFEVSHYPHASFIVSLLSRNPVPIHFPVSSYSTSNSEALSVQLLWGPLDVAGADGSRQATGWERRRFDRPGA
jgi:hypothetical protein